MVSGATSDKVNMTIGVELMDVGISQVDEANVLKVSKVLELREGKDRVSSTNHVLNYVSCTSTIHGSCEVNLSIRLELFKVVSWSSLHFFNCFDHF